jgi:hypothetical protein
MKIKIFTTAALVCCVLICFAAAAGLTGKWTGTLKTLDGNEFPLTYNFKTDSDKLTGTAESPEGKWEIADGKISGDDFSFVVTVHENMKINHTGKYYAQGDSVSLNIDMNGQPYHTALKRTTDK